MATPETLVTAPEAGQILGCSGRTVVRKAERGEIPIAHKLPGPNGAFLFRREDVLALLDAPSDVAAAS